MEMLQKLHGPLEKSYKLEEGVSEDSNEERESFSVDMAPHFMCNMEKDSVQIKEEDSVWESIHHGQESVCIKEEDCEWEAVKIKEDHEHHSMCTDTRGHENVNSVKNETLKSEPVAHHGEITRLAATQDAGRSFQKQAVLVKCELFDSKRTEKTLSQSHSGEGSSQQCPGDKEHSGLKASSKHISQPPLQKTATTPANGQKKPRSILGKRRREICEVLREVKRKNQEIVEKLLEQRERHIQLLREDEARARAAEAEERAAQAAETAAFNNNFIAVLGQLVEVLSRSYQQQDA
ncbi:uncharacterized protein LOC120534385 [Polypterus senegalus]|uniref:uncharacterized protein LOC120534385 n=1 Tax=Polypterus senegalus TaxID=55291 RepID=UPI00196459CB|nr:uncharacterized protein LOC120534385 [Polypterus senegalus]